MTAEEIATALARFHPDEKEIVTSIITRIDRGRTQYGPWEIDHDHNRNYRREALEELVDGMAYLMADVLRVTRDFERRMRRVYVAHRWSDDPVTNERDLVFICRALIAKGVLPIAPPLYLPQIIDEATNREQALGLCLELLADCDLVLAFGTPSAGMQRELAFARARGIPIRHLQDQEQFS